MGVILVMTCCTVSRSYCFTAYLDGPMHTNILIFIMFYVFMYACIYCVFFTGGQKTFIFLFKLIFILILENILCFSTFIKD